jgi:hypothetical protein
MGRRGVARGLATAGGIGTVVLAATVLWASRAVDPALSPYAAQHGVEALAAVAVVTMGVVLAGRGRELGIAVLVSAGVLALPSLVTLTTLLASLGARGPVIAVLVAPQAVLVVSGGLAFSARRRDRWRWRAPWSLPYAIAAAGAVIAACSPWVADPLLGAPGVGSVVAPRADLASLAGLVSVGTLLVTLLGAARLPRRLAAGLLSAVVAQALPVALLAVHQAARAGWVVTPSGWLMVVSATALMIVAVWWRDADRRADHQRRDSLADVAGLP